MPVLALVNQKGGSGKTTTAVNLGACLAEDGASVLVVDMDPQANATLALGVDPGSSQPHGYDAPAPPLAAGRFDTLIVGLTANLDLAPAGAVLALLGRPRSEPSGDDIGGRLVACLDRVGWRYDYVVIDCPPSLGDLTLAAVRASDRVIVPVETGHFAIAGIERALDAIALFSLRVGHATHVKLLPTLFDGRTRFARRKLAEIRASYADACFDSVIRVNVKLAEAAEQGIPVCRFAPSSNGASDYAALAVEARELPPEAPTASRDEPTGTGLAARALPLR